MFRKSTLSFALMALAGAGMSASAEEISLFPATPVTPSGFSADFEQTRIYAESETTVFCGGTGTAYLRSEGKADNSLIVDNYVTLNDADDQSICTGGSDLEFISGTNCFTSGSTNSKFYDDAINTVFESDATAPVSLAVGRNDLEFSLWDWGGVFGNTALELALPKNCSSYYTVSLCAAQDQDIGSVSVVNDDETIYITFEIDEPGWYLAETHVAVGEIPTNRGGNPQPGRFPWSCEASGTLGFEAMQFSCTAEVPKGNLEPGDPVDIAAHASAFQLDRNGNFLGDETAWGAACYEGEGERISNRGRGRGNWGTQFTYTIE